MDLFGFYRVASRLKVTKRAGWARRTPSADVESVADHSLMTSMLSLILAEDRGLDAQRCAALAAVHDLAESVVGDMLPDEVPPDEKHAMEREALAAIAGLLGDGEILLRLYDEYELGETAESRLVHQVDKLEMALQAISYYMDGLLSREDACEFVEGALRHISDHVLVEHLRSALRSSGLSCPTLRRPPPGADPFISRIILEGRV
ncbi:MAG: HD domain-containing protein [Conexivisphaera sp.]